MGLSLDRNLLAISLNAKSGQKWIREFINISYEGVSNNLFMGLVP